MRLYQQDVCSSETSVSRAKIFWSGRSQAVRLPKHYRFEGKEVRIRRHGAAVVLEPIATDWSWLDAITGDMSEDFFKDGFEKPAAQERSELRKLFK